MVFGHAAKIDIIDVYGFAVIEKCSVSQISSTMNYTLISIDPLP